MLIPVRKLLIKVLVEIQNLGFAFVTGENTTGINSGTISLLQNGKDPAPSPIVLLATNGGSATNAGTITGKVSLNNIAYLTSIQRAHVKFIYF